MIDFFKKIFDYHHHHNQLFGQTLKDNIDQISERSIPLFSHNINAHIVWNRRVVGNADFSDLKQEYTIDECLELDKQNYEATLDILAHYSIDDIIEYQNNKGELFEQSLRDILFHIGNHTMHHRGQIISDLRKVGIPPHRSDFIFFDADKPKT